MDEDQKDEYIYLLVQFRNAALETFYHSGCAFSKEALHWLSRMDEFEDALPCNQEGES